MWSYAVRTVFLGALMVSVLASCASTVTADKVLAPGAQPKPARADAYPDFSRPVTSAMPQMGDEEANRIAAEMEILAKQRRTKAISEDEYWRRVKEMSDLSRPPS
jgi:hypothetical protein